MKTVTAVMTLAVAVLFVAGASLAGPYVTDPSAVRWNDVGGLQWNFTDAVRWNDVGGVRWNDVGAVRWNDVGGTFIVDAQGVSWSDVGAVRWNDVGGIQFLMPPGTKPVTVDLDLLPVVSFLPDTSAVNVIISYETGPDPSDLDALSGLGILGGKLFRRLPMVAVNATKSQIAAIASLPNVRSIWSDKSTSLFDDASAKLIGLPEAWSDPELQDLAGQPYSGLGVTIAVLDSGVDATHPDLPYGSKVVENVRLTGGVPAGPGFLYPPFVEGLANTDLVLGHGTFVASVAAGAGDASAGLYAGVAPGASILALSAGDFFIIDVLEGFDYILDHAVAMNIRVVNCSWGTQGWFDPDDPVNIATRELHQQGISVVFAAGNHGSAPDTLNPYSVAPWVIGVGSVDRSGELSRFSSRGIHEELIYRPTLVAPGAAIIAAKSGALGGVDGVVGVADPGAGASVPPEHQASYTISSGTSFAAPHVAGTIALMLEADPTLTPDEIKRLIQQSATPDVRYERSEIGAGRLDAWGSLAATIHPARPFGTHVPSWLDQRPFGIVHLASPTSKHPLATGGSVALPIVVDPQALTLDLYISWGDDVVGADLDLEVLDPQGAVLASSTTINGLGLFGRTEGAHLTGELPDSVTAVVTFKEGTDGSDVDFYLRVENTIGTLPAYPDVDALPDQERRAILRAVTRKLMIGRDGQFAPYAALDRGELARSLALVGGMPQRLPGSRSFSDVGPSNPDAPFIETAAGRRSQVAAMSPQGSRFRPNHAVRRIDFAVGLVRAANLAELAEARAGESLGLADEAQIPDRLRGYAAVALERGFIAATDQGTRFEASGRVLRVEAAGYLLELADYRTPDAPPPVEEAAAGRRTPRGSMGEHRWRSTLRRASPASAVQR